jgi:hypothetical protein
LKLVISPTVQDLFVTIFLMAFIARGPGAPQAGNNAIHQVMQEYPLFLVSAKHYYVRSLYRTISYYRTIDHAMPAIDAELSR